MGDIPTPTVVITVCASESGHATAASIATSEKTDDLLLSDARALLLIFLHSKIPKFGSLQSSSPNLAETILVKQMALDALSL